MGVGLISENSETRSTLPQDSVEQCRNRSVYTVVSQLWPCVADLLVLRSDRQHFGPIRARTAVGWRFQV
jgi:hypothetical protein